MMVCTPVPDVGGLQAHLRYIHEGRAVQSVEGKLCNHGEGHALRCHPVLLTRAIQKTAGGLLWLPGQVSSNLNPYTVSAVYKLVWFLVISVPFILRYSSFLYAVILLV